MVAVDVGLRRSGESLRDAISCSLDLAGLRYADRGESVNVEESTNRLVRRLARSVDAIPREQVAVGVPIELLTREEAMGYLRIKSDKLFELTKPIGPIPRVQLGNRVLYRLDDLRLFVESKAGDE